MHAKKIIGILFTAAVVLAVVHYISLELDWNYYYPHFDIFMHLLGGFVSGLFGYALIVTATQMDVSAELNLAGIVVFVLAVAVAWEVFESVFSLTTDAGMSAETISDIIFGIVGGLISWCVATAIQK